MTGSPVGAASSSSAADAMVPQPLAPSSEPAQHSTDSWAFDAASGGGGSSSSSEQDGDPGAAAAAILTITALNAMHAAAAAAAAAVAEADGTASPSPSISAPPATSASEIATSAPASSGEVVKAVGSVVTPEVHSTSRLEQVAIAAAATAAADADAFAAFAVEDAYLNLNGESTTATELALGPAASAATHYQRQGSKLRSAAGRAREAPFPRSPITAHASVGGTSSANDDPESAEQQKEAHRENALLSLPDIPWYAAAAEAPPPPPAPLALAGLGLSASARSSSGQQPVSPGGHRSYSAADDPAAARDPSSASFGVEAGDRSSSATGNSQESAFSTSHGSRAKGSAEGTPAKRRKTNGGASCSSRRKSTGTTNKGRKSNGSKRGSQAQNDGQEDEATKEDDSDADSGASDADTTPVYSDLGAKIYADMPEEQRQTEQNRLRQLLEERLREGNQGSRHIRVTRQYFLSDLTTTLMLHPEPCTSCTKARPIAPSFSSSSSFTSADLCCIVTIGRVKCAACTSKGESCSLGSIRSSAKRKKAAAEERSERKRRKEVRARWIQVRDELAREAEELGLVDGFARTIREKINEAMAATFDGAGARAGSM
ncbi:unnamed protein product [Tilletia controversa]|uniref:Uncharacterized protein n=3 Tax=Tilletia TaxID=13289 RepID=A0A8X7MJG6_9BASI|nr:hypothetical protein CF336_g8656 [Tilletia laevis]KAE8183215.1 hypothetical protein CF328_g8257 [Tilletia controversa]KAE8240715.1 hypothetical protein A4X03_0g8432 [Tilletia caries]KAE8182911.1 hypothetical protein CF335_g8487 [Tilletia laevis]KAE8238261.1 hypothetical protein A4X06_0g8908 [Tilletia controversa]